MTSILEKNTARKIKIAPAIPRQTRFTNFFVQKNGMDGNHFKEWIFYPGMLFRSPDKWWGDQRMRARPHEGLDLCLYRDRENQIIHLKEGAKIPAVYDGVIVRIIEDFLGKSIFIEHSLSTFDRSRLYTIYGHSIPHPELSIGKTVQQGDTIGTIADANRSNTHILTHLHISLGWTTDIISHDKLDWETISKQGVLTLLDPLEIIDGGYRILKENINDYGSEITI